MDLEWSKIPRYPSGILPITVIDPQNGPTPAIVFNFNGILFYTTDTDNQSQTEIQQILASSPQRGFSVVRNLLPFTLIAPLIAAAFKYSSSSLDVTSLEAEAIGATALAEEGYAG